MTKDEILAMKPGRELDALVAEKVMGWVLPPHSSVVGQMWVEFPHGMVHPEGLHPWSTDISAAWEVVEKMNKDERFNLALEWYGNEQEWGADFDEWGITSQVLAKTAPEAICKAALIAVLEEE